MNKFHTPKDFRSGNMFPATAPFPAIAEIPTPRDSEADAAKKKQRTSCAGAACLRNGFLATSLQTMQFVCPVLGMFLCVALYSSEHWIVTDTSYHWGLMTKCQPDSGGNNGTVICSYMSPGENAAYFEAAQALSSIALLLSVLLLVHYVLIKVKCCRHQLPALLALLETICLIAVLLLVAVNYSDDSRWKDKGPALGWSYWVAVAATVFSFMATVTLSYMGRQEYTNPDSTVNSKETSRISKVHPHPLQDNEGVIASGQERSTQWEPQGQDGHPDLSSASSPRRPWKRRLSPISERRVSSEDAERGSEPPPEESPRLELDDEFGHRASVHPVPDIVVTPHSPLPYNSDSDH